MSEAENGAQALELIDRDQPNVAVLDMQVPEGSGIAVTRRLRAAGASLGILILAAYDDPPYVRAAIDAGADGYALKSWEAQDIVGAVRAVFEGKAVLGVHLPRLSQRWQPN